MQDVSVRVGGLSNSGYGSYAQNFKLEDTIETAGASLCMVENYSPWTFQIGGYIVPAMHRRTFSVENYPSLKWSINNGVQLIGNPNGVDTSIGELRTVKIILDPPQTTTDGPVYPNPHSYSGVIDATTTPDVTPTTVGVYLLDVRDIIDSAFSSKWNTGGLNWGAGVRDPAFVGFQVMVSDNLTATNGPVGQYDNVSRLAAVQFGVPMPQTFWRPGHGLDGKVYTQYWDLPGPSLLRILTGSRITAGSIMWTAWIGYHV